MPERGFDTGFWTEDFVLGLPYPAKHLFHYLGSNDHCNQAGAYHIVPKTISFESGIPESELPALLKALKSEVKWLPEENLIWVKNFIYLQAKSPKFLIAAAKCLKKIRNNGLAAEVVEYNLHHYGVSIPYEYPIDRVSIPSVSDSVSDSVSSSSSVSDKKVGVVKGKEKIPPSESEIEESLSAGDREAISVWRSVKGFSMPNEEAAELVAKLRTEFPDVDILDESKAWAARKLSEPLKPRSRPSSQIWNWIRKAREFAQERRKGEQQSRTHQRGTKEPSDERYRQSLKR